MATITVRLDEDDERLLDSLATSHGGRSAAIRQAIRALAGDLQRNRAIDEFLAAWEAEAGPADEDEIAAMIERYHL